MGAAVGCTKELCFNNNVTEVNLELRENKITNLYTLNTNKNELTKPALNENEKEHNNNNLEEENEKEEGSNDIIEEEEQEKEIEKEKSFEDNNEDNNDDNNEENEEDNNDDNNDDNNEENNEEENEDNNEENSEDNKEKNNEENNGNDNEDNNDNRNENINKYIEFLPKIILIQKTYKHHFVKFNRAKGIIKSIPNSKKEPLKKRKKVDFKIEKSHTVINNNSMKKDLHKYNYPLMNPDKNKNGKNSLKEEEEELISVEQTYLPVKNSTKMLKNFRAIEFLKPILAKKDLLGNQKNNTILKIHRNNNYLKILSDFDEKKNNYHKNESSIKSSKFVAILSNKEKKDTKIKQNRDTIKGNFILKNEKVIRYQGGFIKKTKKKNGFGIVTWSDNSILQGTYVSSMINGIGRFYNQRYKSTFMGEYTNNAPNGYGVYQIKNLSLQGYWDGSNLRGIAIEVWDDGTYYQGEYENNRKNGIGLYRWPDGTIYQGQFSNGQMTGNGIILYSDDSIFSGEMLNGYMNGYGIFSWGNGPLYMGYYLQDIKHGFGIYIWDTKVFICYIGFWEMGKQQGIGAKINGNKIKYCIWNKGKVATTLKGLYEIDRYLTGAQKGYYHFFTAGYIAKLRTNSFCNFNPK